MNTIRPDLRVGFQFKDGESNALKRLLHHFFEQRDADAYKKTRNQLLGADFRKRFSPWMANGTLSPRLIYHKLRPYENTHVSKANTYWLFFELLWGEYARFAAMKYGKRIFKPGG
jgi:deoxyribodipyrimidine photo-lyase